MGAQTAEISAVGPVDIVHVELKSPPGMVARFKPPAQDEHFKSELENNPVRVLRLRLAPGEKTARYDEPFEHLLVPLTKSARLQSGEVQWLAPGAGADENAGVAPYEVIIVEFKK